MRKSISYTSGVKSSKFLWLTLSNLIFKKEICVNRSSLFFSYLFLPHKICKFGNIKFLTASLNIYPQFQPIPRLKVSSFPILLVYRIFSSPFFTHYFPSNKFQLFLIQLLHVGIESTHLKFRLPNGCIYE